MKTKMRMKVVCICRSMYGNGICMDVWCMCVVEKGVVWLESGKAGGE